MATITKKDFIKRIASANMISQKLVQNIIQQFLDTITEELEQENRLEFRNFGVFQVVHRSGRIAQNPKTLEKVQLDPWYTVKFKPGKLLQEKLNP